MVLDPLAVFDPDTITAIETADDAPDPPDLLDDVPPFEQTSRHVQAVLQVVANELYRIEVARQALILNFFPATADVLLPLFEQLLGLPVDPAGATLDARRQLVMAYMQRLKSEGRGLDWVALVTQAVGTTNWNYAEHDPTHGQTNLAPNPSFEYDAIGANPAGWAFPSNLASRTVQSNYAASGTKSMRLVTNSVTSGVQPNLTISGPINAGAAAPLAFAISPTQQLALRGRANVNSVSGAFNMHWQVNWYNAAGGFLSLSTTSNVAAAVGSPVDITGVVTAPANAAYLSPSIMLLCSSSGTLDVNIDTVGMFYTAAGVVPAYFDGDSSGDIWTGVPGNSGSFSTDPTSLPPANTINVNIPQASAGIAWPFILDITPAHLVVNKGYTGGFIIGSTPVWPGGPGNTI